MTALQSLVRGSAHSVDGRRHPVKVRSPQAPHRCHDRGRRLVVLAHLDGVHAQPAGLGRHFPASVAASATATSAQTRDGTRSSKSAGEGRARVKTHLTASGCCSESMYRYSLMPSALRGTVSCPVAGQAGGRGSQSHVKLPSAAFDGTALSHLSRLSQLSQPQRCQGRQAPVEPPGLHAPPHQSRCSPDRKSVV